VIVESLWCNLKHKHLQEFNHPCLDLITHIILTDVLPCIQQKLDHIQGLWHVRRAKALAGWQTDFWVDWLEMSLFDEHCLTAKQLKLLKAPKKTKGHTERLAALADEEA
jgi:hypothetical protein